ncbi:hypothetical protein ACI0FM_00045 [Paenochrobactrum sp. BZR 588]|uniref:hypothetical protein n=1 Tax=unclassified Paenochrobactrum TaxID=2639760 RepID=UPI003852E94E
MTYAKSAITNEKAKDRKIETVEEPTKSAVRDESQIPAKGPKVEKPLKDAVADLDKPAKK